MATLKDRFDMRLDPPTRRALNALCARDHRTKANMVRYLILRAANGLPEVMTSQEVGQEMDQKAVQPLVGEDGYA